LDRLGARGLALAAELRVDDVQQRYLHVAAQARERDRHLQRAAARRRKVGAAENRHQLRYAKRRTSSSRRSRVSSSRSTNRIPMPGCRLSATPGRNGLIQMTSPSTSTIGPESSGVKRRFSRVPGCSGDVVRTKIPVALMLVMYANR